MHGANVEGGKLKRTPPWMKNYSQVSKAKSRNDNSPQAGAHWGYLELKAIPEHFT